VRRFRREAAPELDESLVEEVLQVFGREYRASVHPSIVLTPVPAHHPVSWNGAVHPDGNPAGPVHDRTGRIVDGMRLRLVVIAAALALGAGAGEPAFAAVPVPGGGSSPADASGRAVVVTGSLKAAGPGGIAILLIDVGRRHPQAKPLSVVTTAATVITKGGRAVRLSTLTGTKVTVTGKRSGDKVAASKVAG
jgi:hypothetical protein